MSKVLFEGSSDSEPEIARLKTNEDYAKSYNKFRQQELIKKYRDKNGVSESSSEDDSDSSDDGIVSNKRFDAEFYKTLALLKSKNPRIYNKETTFFQNVDDNTESSEKQKKQKAITIRDYERKVLLEKGGKFEDESDNDYEDREDFRAAEPSYVEEQKKLKSEIKKVMDSDDNDDEEFGGIFRKREKSKEEKTQEEEEFSAWLAGKKEKIDESKAKTLNPLKEYWSNPSLAKQEQFLRDYILNNGYENRDTYDIPTYDEVIADCSDDEKELEKQEEFEHKYNFRYEEPDQDFIKRYPRTIDISVRKKDERRKEKRLEVKERKLKEKEQKFKELEMLKELKRNEIQEKIQKLKEVTGNEELPFKEEELDEDFDPAAHDRRMQEIFNEQYYDVDEGEEKPECPEIEDLKVEDWDNFDPKKDDRGIDDDYEPHCDDEDFNMDCDYDPQAAKEELQSELIENTKSKRKRRRRNQFMEMIKKEKPAFNPDDEITYGEYIDEYYNMDCEDIIGDTPCRFKYVETEPNDFGLTIEEILLAKNKELNQWVSLKKAVQIKPKQAEIRDRKLYRMKAKNETLKRKIFPSIYGPPSDGEDDEQQPNAASKPVDIVKKEVSGDETSKAKKKKKKKKKKGQGDAGIISVDAIQTTNPSEKLNNTKSSENEHELNKSKTEKFEEESKNETVKSVAAIPVEVNSSTENKKKKKKKKKKQTENAIPDDKSTKSENENNNTQNTVQAKVSQKSSGKVQKEKSVKSSTDSKTTSTLVQDKPSDKNSKQFKKSGEKEHVKSKTKIFAKGKSYNSTHTFNDNNFLDSISDERLRAYGLNPRKFRKQMNFNNPSNTKFKHVSNKKTKIKKKVKETK